MDAPFENNIYIFFYFRYRNISQENLVKCRVVCDTKTSSFAILMSRVRARVEVPLFFLSYFFQFLLFFCTRQFSAFNSFTFLYISDVKIVELPSLSTFVVYLLVEHCDGDVLAAQCLMTDAKVSKCGVIHHSQWENCYGRVTKCIKMHQFCITTVWASYER